MTVAVGFLNKEGVVLCSDSELTINDYIKCPADKVSFAVSKNYAIAFASAGSFPYIQTALDEVVSPKLSKCKSLAAIKSFLRKELFKFFNSHLADFPESERPPVSLLIGVSAKDAFGLFHYTERAFHPVDHHVIGVGEIRAANLISDYWSRDESLDNLTRISVYAVSQAKKEVSGCGGHTFLTQLGPGGEVRVFDSAGVEKLETELDGMESWYRAEWKKKIVLSIRLPRVVSGGKRGIIRTPRNTTSLD